MDTKALLAKQLAEIIGMEAQEIENMFETPPNREMGDIALPCFKLARVLRKAPPAIAAELTQKLTLPESVKEARAEGGYLNFFLDGNKRVCAVLDAVAAQQEKYGSSQKGEGKTICIDYSSINIAKRCHIGHLSTTAIGNALYKIYSFLGHLSLLFLFLMIM